MTTIADPVFVDTNVLVYARTTGSPFHATAVARLDELADAGTELWVSRQVLREYLAAMTRSQVAPAVPTPDLLADVRGFQLRFAVAEDGPDVTDELLRLLAAVPCGGRQVYDANVAATMLARGVPALLTHNVADFQRFVPRITVLPLVP